MLVFPIQVVCAGPFVGRLVESVAHIVAAVATLLQNAGVTALVVNHVHAHHIAVAEPTVVYPRHGELLDVGRQTYAAAVVLQTVIKETVAATAERSRHNCRKIQDYIID